MIAAYHVIFSMYGFWLPNDPRGSWSDFVGSWNLFRYGQATKTNQRHSLAYHPHDRQQREAAKATLKYAPVQLNGLQARAVARGFAEYVRLSKLQIHACAILPDHVHLVLGTMPMPVERVIVRLKGAATRQLEAEQIHPLAAYKQPGKRVPKCFARGEWKVFLDPEDVPRAICYVNGNPLKEGKKKQEWTFVRPYC